MQAQQTAQRPAARRPINWNKILNMVFKYMLLIFLSVIVTAPVLTAIFGGMRSNGEFLAHPLALPQHGIRWENYESILDSSDFWRGVKNSFLITIGATLLNVSLASMMAFVFSRMKFRGRNLLFNIIALGLLFPIVVAALPLFIELRDMNILGHHIVLTGSRWGVILPLVAFGLPTSVVILRGFFMSIPRELEEAAYIDGASAFGFFLHILLPISRPALSAVVTLNMVAAWNDYFLSLLVLGATPDKWPLTMGIMQYQTDRGTDWAGIMAYVTILIIPAVVFYLFTEKMIVTGLTGGELKG
jgi:raffinose/stachyose/melibiose transport system permease protein